MLRVFAVLPSDAGWQAGARWFRCDLIQVDATNDEVISRTGTLRGSLKGAAPLALRCFQSQIRGDRIGGMTAVDCKKPHDAEFAGLWTAPEMSYAKLSASDDKVGKGCRSTIADWAEIPDNGDVKFRLGYLSFAPNAAEWNHGIREVQCFLWLNGKRVKGSYRGAGTGKLPINYR
jgi:hypothetical protein